MKDKQLIEIISNTIRGAAFYQYNVRAYDIVVASGILDRYEHDATDEQCLTLMDRGYPLWCNENLDAEARLKSSEALLAYVRERCQGMVKL